LFMGILDIQKGVLNFCNAGHSPTFLLSGSGNVKELNDQHGLPLGLYPQRDYKDSTVSIHKGDTLVLYTDGITEHVNESGEFFGVDGFFKLFNQIKNNSPEEIARLIMDDVDKFGGDVSQSDDLTLMVLSYN
jgi:phosphoserine phosphatase RsbU/P